MLCKSITESEAESRSFWDGFLANTKFDGERIKAIKKDGEVFLVNRRGNIKNNNYREVVDELEDIEGNFEIDGEVISMNDNFDELQRRSLTKDKFKQMELRKSIPVKYMVFDILKVDLLDLRNSALKRRIEFENVICDKHQNHIEFAEYKPVLEILRRAKIEGREGIVIKDMSETYHDNKRHKGWLKCKFFKETTLELINYTENPAGIRCEDKDKNAVQISGTQHLEVKQLLDTTGKAVVEIQYLEKTKDGRFRFPSFRGLVDEQGIKEAREDKAKYDAFDDLTSEAGL